MCINIFNVAGVVAVFLVVVGLVFPGVAVPAIPFVVVLLWVYTLGLCDPERVDR